jgi:hypothetical protein
VGVDTVREFNLRDAQRVSRAERQSSSGDLDAVSDSGERKSSKQKARPAPAATARPRGRGHELIPVICSECYEDFIFDSGVATKNLTCPVCEHQAARPDDALLHKINELRSAEKKALTLSLGLVALGLCLMLAWALLSRNPHNHDGVAFWGPLGVGLLGLLAGGGLGLAKYEGARHETYF